ncbi:MAG: diguanylate cyclase, partial [Gammaproteobacteria bacterium]|nr:diguanylate cyclase [Gammaproteobacteria bacterium]
MSKALLLLDELKVNEIDTVVTGQVRAMLTAAQQTHQDFVLACSSIQRLTLAAFAERVAGHDPVFEKQLQILALRLTPPLLTSELAVVHDYLHAIIKSKNNSISSVPAEAIVQSPTVTITQDVANRQTVDGNIHPENSCGVSVADTDVRDQLQHKNQEFTQIRTTLSRHVNEAIAQNQEFGVLLGVELDALREAERIQDVEKRRVSLINEVNKFVKKHRLLTDKFDNANKYLSLVESSNQHLSDELDRVRLLSLTDELTALPNRRAFLRRMEDEVGRVKRYAVPVSVTIIDLDGFKAINDLRGHGGGDAVLRGYAEQILSVFRHHDMVARYGGEEFAVILPNTGLEGGLRALQKVQSRVSDVVCMHNGERFPMPSFSAGLAEYHHGETL